MKLLLNNIEIPHNEYTGRDGTTIELQSRDEYGHRERRVSQEYEFTGSAYDIVAQFFIDNPQGSLASIPVKIFDDECCGTDVLLFEGVLKSENVEWCDGACSVRCVFTEHTEYTRAMDCIRSTFIWDNRNGFQSQNHPRIAYCNSIRPEFLQYLLLSYGIMLNLNLLVLTPVVAVITLIITVINGIIDAVNLIPGVSINHIGGGFGSGEENLLAQYSDMRDRMNERIIACGFRHPAPLVRSYINNVCSICNLQFESSILNNPGNDYWNMVYLFAPSRKGVKEQSNGNIPTWIDDNKQNQTLDMFLDDLKTVFNARWEIINGVLRFERVDSFQSEEDFVNYEAIIDRVIEPVCYSYRTVERPAAVEFKYVPDALDNTSGEAINVYNDIIGWNEPYSPMQHGIKQVVLPYSPCRFRGDGVTEDIYENFENFPFIGQAIRDNRGTLILEKDKANTPRLIIWDGQSTVFAKCRRFYVPGFGLMDDNVFNFPLLFNEHNSVPNQAYPIDHPQSGLYPRFYSIEQPKVSLANDQGKEFNFSFEFNCQDIQKAFNARYVQLPIGRGTITNMSISLSNRTITISGNV